MFGKKGDFQIEYKLPSHWMNIWMSPFLICRLLLLFPFITCHLRRHSNVSSLFCKNSLYLFFLFFFCCLLSDNKNIKMPIKKAIRILLYLHFFFHSSLNFFIISEKKNYFQVRTTALSLFSIITIPSWKRK